MAHASEKRILVVDDEPDVRNFLAACIEDAGFQVQTAADGVQALEKIRADAPDLVTLDMVMPRKSGIKVIRELRAIPKFSQLPVIVITAHAHDEMGSGDIKSFNAFTSGLRPRYTMEKPVTPDRLIRAICEILNIEIVDPQAADAAPVSDRQAIMDMLKSSDAATLGKIRTLLQSRN